MAALQVCFAVKQLKLACLSWKGMAGAQTWQACCLVSVEEVCKVPCPAMPSSPVGGCVMAAWHACTCALGLKLAQHRLGSFTNAESIQACC